jgi:hypothetical protein
MKHNKKADPRGPAFLLAVAVGRYFTTARRL